jgi:hypothetical protein
MFNKIKKKIRIDLSKNTKLFFYIKGAWILFTSKFVIKNEFDNIYDQLSGKDKEYIDKRVSYYNKQKLHFKKSKKAISIKEFVSLEKKKTYFFDLLEYLRFFDKKNKVDYIFGDVITVPEYPSIVKSRPIEGDNSNSIFMKLNKIRHFIFVNDDLEFENKKDMAVWRGKCYVKHREEFVKRFYDKSFCDIGQTNTKGDLTVEWQKKKLSLKEQLKYKFLIAIEGNDVASNLKWAMSSNSLVLMSRPKYETWFMEGTLIENFHYVLLNDDYSDMEEKINYYLENISEAKEIIRNANEYIEQFKNKKFEDIISYMVLKKYFNLSKELF